MKKKIRKPWSDEARARHKAGVKRWQEECEIRKMGRYVQMVADKIGEDRTETLHALCDMTCHDRGEVSRDEWLKQRIGELRHENGNKREECRLYQSGECRREDCWRLLEKAA